MHVLLGAEGILASGRVSVIQFELHRSGPGLPPSLQTLSGVMHALEGWGYTCVLPTAGERNMPMFLPVTECRTDTELVDSLRGWRNAMCYRYANLTIRGLFHDLQMIGTSAPDWEAAMC